MFLFCPTPEYIEIFRLESLHIWNFIDFERCHLHFLLARIVIEIKSIDGWFLGECSNISSHFTLFRQCNNTLAVGPVDCWCPGRWTVQEKLRSSPDSLLTQRHLFRELWVLRKNNSMGFSFGTWLSCFVKFNLKYDLYIAFFLIRSYVLKLTCITEIFHYEVVGALSLIIAAPDIFVVVRVG